MKLFVSRPVIIELKKEPALFPSLSPLVLVQTSFNL